MEAGSVNKKNEINIMMKNAIDVFIGGLAYWTLGFGLSFGEGTGSNWFNGAGSFFFNPSGPTLGSDLALFFFQVIVFLCTFLLMSKNM